MATSLSDSVTNNHRNRSDPLIRLENVDKIFQMGEVAVQAMSDVSLQIHPGELLAMVGPSGSGKSTNLNIVGGLDNVTSGKVWFGEQLLSDFSARVDAISARHGVIRFPVL